VLQYSAFIYFKEKQCKEAKTIMQLKFVINTHFVFSTMCFVHDDAEFVSVTRQFIACELISLSLSLSLCEMLTHNATYQQTIVEMVTEGFLTSALAKLAT